MGLLFGSSFEVLVIALILVSGSKANPLVESAVAFYNSTIDSTLRGSDETLLLYGVKIPNNQILLPRNADLWLDDFQEIRYFNGVKNSSLTYNFENCELVQLNDNCFILKGSRTIHSYIIRNDTLRISRYPIDYGFDFKTVIVDYEHNILNIEIFKKSDEECIESFPNFNKNTQVCAKARKETEAGIPLMVTYDNVTYIVGLSAPKTSDNATLYDLIVDSVYTFPLYDKCMYVKESPAKFVYCNAVEISQNIKTFGSDGIVLIGNIQNKSNFDFIPIGLATVISDDQAIVPSSVLDSLDNFEIFGNGEKIKIALMINGVLKFPEIIHSDSNTRMLKFVKFTEPIFNNTKKAIFLFEESLKDLDKIKDIDIFQFKNQQFELQKRPISKSEKEKNKMFEKFLFGAPVFYNENVVGFQDGDSHVSILESKQFLQEKFPTLLVATLEIHGNQTTTQPQQQ